MKKILVVEDVREMALCVEAIFEGHPHWRVSHIASNTIEARQRCLRDRPDLILLDELLPGESSLDFFQECVSRGISIVWMTSQKIEDRVGSVSVSDVTPKTPDPKEWGRIMKPTLETFDLDRVRILKYLEEWEKV